MLFFTRTFDLTNQKKPNHVLVDDNLGFAFDTELHLYKRIGVVFRRGHPLPRGTTKNF
jgi:hypothetical protein